VERIRCEELRVRDERQMQMQMRASACDDEMPQRQPDKERRRGETTDTSLNCTTTHKSLRYSYDVAVLIIVCTSD